MAQFNSCNIGDQLPNGHILYWTPVRNQGPQQLAHTLVLLYTQDDADWRTDRLLLLLLMSLLRRWWYPWYAAMWIPVVAALAVWRRFATTFYRMANDNPTARSLALSPWMMALWAPHNINNNSSSISSTPANGAAPTCWVGFEGVGGGYLHYCSR